MAIGILDETNHQRLAELFRQTDMNNTIGSSDNYFEPLFFSEQLCFSNSLQYSNCFNENVTVTLINDSVTIKRGTNKPFSFKIPTGDDVKIIKTENGFKITYNDIDYYCIRHLQDANIISYPYLQLTNKSFSNYKKTEAQFKQSDLDRLHSRTKKQIKPNPLLSKLMK